ncbi:prepilin peptidase [Candidatus Saccharibacteria bacterium]|nr:prepilin peptidase [Candidatus Saccharibacteria bacterium]
MEVLFLILLFILGACLGSFLCCQARRLHHRSKKGSSKLNSRSICLHCKYQLKWYDNIPIISWFCLRGKCRKCHKPIGWAEILTELGLGLAWLALGTTINITTADPLIWTIFIVTLILTLPLAFLSVYDGLYGELPTKHLLIAIAIAVIILSLKQTVILLDTGFTPDIILRPLGAVLVLGGLYLILYLISHGKWVGDGDWLLGVAIGLALADVWLALIALFIANLLACLCALPNLKKSKKIYFGPFLAIAFVITLTFADFFYYAIGG